MVLRWKCSGRRIQNVSASIIVLCMRTTRLDKKVVFYQLRDDKWVALHSPADALQPSQLLQPPLKDHLPKGFNPRHCAPEWDEVKLRRWHDAEYRDSLCALL